MLGTEPIVLNPAKCFAIELCPVLVHLKSPPVMGMQYSASQTDTRGRAPLLSCPLTPHFNFLSV